jgi:hypothetical protein
MNFTSSNVLWLGCCFAFGFRAMDKSGRSNCSQLFFAKVPIGRIFFESFFFKRVAYQKIKIEDGIDMEVQENLGFIRFMVLPSSSNSIGNSEG